VQVISRRGLVPTVEGMTQHYDYLIVGGGMAAAAAAKAIREHGVSGTIGILGEESTAPFPRPALSKKLWTDPDFTQQDADLDVVGATRADLVLDTRVVTVDVEAKQVVTEDGGRIGYDQLLVTTGGHPREIDGLAPGDRVLYYRTLSDYRHLRELVAERPHVVVVGGGYIGSEIAAALIGQDCRVTLIHPDEVLGGPMFPASLAATFQQLFTDAGVDVRGGLSVTGGAESPDGVSLELSDGSTLTADLAVVGLGISPAGEVLADVAARSDDGGIVVDERLATDAPSVFAAGDVAEYPDRILGRRRVEHVDNAESMGAAAGRIMAGSDEVYDHTPMFYSDVLEHGYEAVGVLDSDLETVEDPYDDGLVVYYLDDEAVRGVLLWDCEGGLDAARELLAQHRRPADANELVGSVR